MRLRRWVLVLVLLYLILGAVVTAQGPQVPFFVRSAEVQPPPSLVGTPESLRWQNFKLIALEGLRHIKDDEELSSMIEHGELISIPWGPCLVPDKKLDLKWQYSLPRAIKFLEDRDKEACEKFGNPVQVNSATRHIIRQMELVKQGNLNAAPVQGERASTHLTGASVDLAVVGVPQPITNWLKVRLVELERLGLVDATLETGTQSVLHITVFADYDDKTARPP